ncbi:hypothetical protein V1507DRAFT_465330 [Lipomyces tetrasporus]
MQSKGLAAVFGVNKICSLTILIRLSCICQPILLITYWPVCLLGCAIHIFTYQH